MLVWKNESSTARDGNWSSTQIRSGKKGKREKGQRNSERGTQRQSVWVCAIKEALRVETGMLSLSTICTARVLVCIRICSWSPRLRSRLTWEKGDGTPVRERLKFLRYLERNKGGGEKSCFRKLEGIFYTVHRITRHHTYSHAAWPR